MRECILLAACGANELLPQNPELPADVFTSCLTTPIKVSPRYRMLPIDYISVHVEMVAFSWCNGNADSTLAVQPPWVAAAISWGNAGRRQLYIVHCNFTEQHVSEHQGGRHAIDTWGSRAGV